MAKFEHVRDSLRIALSINKDTPVVFEVRSGKLFIGTNNLYHSVVVEVPTTWEDMKFVLTSKIAQEMPKILQDHVSFELKDESVRMITKGTRNNLALLDPKSLMLTNLVTHFSHEPVWEVDGEEFSEAVRRVQHSANNAALGDVGMKSYYFTPFEDTVELMATTGQVMSVTRCPLTPVGDSEHETILLNPEFAQIAKVLGGKTTLSYNHNALSITSEYEDGMVVRCVSARTHVKTQIPYRPVLENVEKNRVLFSVDRKFFLEAVKRTNFFSGEAKKNRVDVVVAGGKVTLAADNSYGSSNTVLDVEDEGWGLSFSLGGDSLARFLANSRGGMITVRAKDDRTPILLTDELSKEIITVYIGGVDA